MTTAAQLLALAALAVAWRLAADCAEPDFGSPPRAPGPESWTFRDELSAPERFPAPPVGEGRPPWLRERISRCFFGPIKRAPYFRDELMDDVDYYPEEYLKRLQREGVNGLWLTVAFRDLASAPFLPPPENAERRFAKLRKTVADCAKFGIKTWLFSIEPTYKWQKDSELVKAHPDWFGPEARGNFRVMCTSAPEVRAYLENAAYEIFSKAPGLGGLIVLSHGECPSTCLSSVSPTSDGVPACQRCRKLKPWEIHANTMGSILNGVKRANPAAKVVSWLYHPQAKPGRGEWVEEIARHLPEGLVLQYNFESGVECEQAGKTRCGGDYWLSEPGPSAPFRTVAAAVRESGGQLSAKIQTCNSHELATVPYVPVPGLLYRKFKALRAQGVTSAMMCWYFGNYPGVMNRAAGELACSDFTESEDAFLLRLARPQWGEQAEMVAQTWKAFSDGYAAYPLDNSMQYYGPFHAGVIWPLWADVNLKPLVETWGPDRPTCGDMIGECLGKFNLSDALAQARKMAAGFDAPLDVLVAPNAERAKDLGVMKAVRILVVGGADILSFYRLRAQAIHASRVLRDHAAAAGFVREMGAIVDRAARLTEEMVLLCESDSRLGFHSEAERHQFHPASLRWRRATLEMTRARLQSIERGLAAGEPYPESAFESSAPKAHVGDAEMSSGKGLLWMAETNSAGDLIVKGRVVGALRRFSVAVTDTAGTVNAKVRTPTIAADGSFELVFSHDDWAVDAHERPGWILFQTDFGCGYPLWPASDRLSYGRLNIGAVWGRAFGRLVWPDSGARP